MSRAIITASRNAVVHNAFPELVEPSPAKINVAVQQEEEPDTYRDRLFKYIPAEVVTLHLGLTKIVAAATGAPHFMYWVIFFAGLIGTPIYLRYAHNVTARTQLIVSTAAFAVWVFALGEPFSEIDGYKPVYAAVLLPIFTFFVAVVSPAQPKQSQQQGS